MISARPTAPALMPYVTALTPSNVITVPLPIAAVGRSHESFERIPARRPLRLLPSLNLPSTSTAKRQSLDKTEMKDIGSQDVLGARAQPSAQGTVSFPLFTELRSGPVSQWQKLSMVALTAEPSLFTRSVREPAPHWSPEMLKTFLEEPNLELWSLVPGATIQAASLRDNADGPLRLVPPSAQVPELNTPLQYSVQRSAELDKEFAKLKSEYGSHYAFHGSLLHNWHQIITQGLEPKSGTALQANGRYHGDGLYVATHSALSKDFLGKTDTRVLGLVEVIDHSSIISIGQAWVIPSRVFAALRFIAVYEPGNEVPDVRQSVLNATLATPAAT